MRSWLRASIFSAIALASTVAVTGAERTTGYLTSGEFDVTQVLEPAPKPGDPRYETDRKIFRATRHLIGTSQDFPRHPPPDRHAPLAAGNQRR